MTSGNLRQNRAQALTDDVTTVNCGHSGGGQIEMAKVQRITPCLWFDKEGEDAANFYTGIFKNSRIVTVTRYGKAGFEFHQRPEGSAMTILFELEGQRFTALNAGPQFRFTEAVSFQVNCDTQEEIDYYWEKLSAGGDPTAQQCGWLKDKFGLSWQIVPSMMEELFKGGAAKAERTMAALLKMKKLDIAALKSA
jgi:predicted 3-demethylubiquinone-9 3-methyltransferase (glyoxalase superfamily)